MKIIHTADIHLGSKMGSRFPAEIAKKRKEEVRATFARMTDYARENGVGAILLCGDVFDGDAPLKKDKDFFYSAVCANPDIQFFYLRGNHDTKEDNSYADIPNLMTFGSAWRTYTAGNVAISGAELSEGNSASVYSSLSLKKDKFNIVMLHGQVGANGPDGINLNKLKERNIDYLALGHIHKPQTGRLDGRGIYAYSGCLEGRGFDEAGEHGFFLLEITPAGKFTHTFVPFAERTIREFDVDVSGIADAYTAFRKIESQIKFDRKDIYRINLVGGTDFSAEDMTDDLEKYLSPRCFYVNVKDRTTRKLDIAAFERDLSIRGEFVRTVYARTDISDEKKLKIAAAGLRVLAGGEAEQ